MHKKRRADNPKVLIVEDECIIAIDIEHHLSDAGYESVGTAATAEEAIRLCADRLPDIVLMDILLKGEMDGIEAARIINERFGIPVLHITANSELLRASGLTPRQSRGCIQKPIDHHALKTAVAKIVGNIAQ